MNIELIEENRVWSILTEDYHLFDCDNTELVSIVGLVLPKNVFTSLVLSIIYNNHSDKTFNKNKEQLNLVRKLNSKFLEQFMDTAIWSVLRKKIHPIVHCWTHDDFSKFCGKIYF
jgi:hypothetical protein